MKMGKALRRDTHFLLKSMTVLGVNSVNRSVQLMQLVWCLLRIIPRNYYDMKFYL